jgi:hypothetical protein
MERWNHNERWNVGMLECWNAGRLECWKVGMLEGWKSGHSGNGEKGRDALGAREMFKFQHPTSNETSKSNVQGEAGWSFSDIDPFLGLPGSSAELKAEILRQKDGVKPQLRKRSRTASNGSVKNARVLVQKR